MSTGLAYVGRVVNLFPIENADRLESAVVVCGEGGKWQGVVAKGDFQVGDKCEIYLQDAVLPDSNPRFLFMQKNRFRVRICRLRGALSEALIMPLTVDGDAGTDITLQMGVVKHEKPLAGALASVAKGNFPSFIPKTDEPNVQREGRMVEALRGKPFVATIKMDGSSATFYKKDGVFGVCSRNLDLKDDGGAFWEAAKRFRADDIPDGHAIQAELCGPSIQGNPAGLDIRMAYAFNVWDIAQQRYLSHAEAVALVAIYTDLPFVRIAAHGKSFDPAIFDDAFWKSTTYQNGAQVEGVVVRPVEEMSIRNERVSFKVINPNYKERD